MSPELTRKDSDDLVKRFAKLCLHDRYREMLTPLVQQWTGKSANGAGARAAVQLLTQGLEHQRHGRFYRRKIYEWSRQQGLSATLADVVTSMCTEVMAVRHPYEAVVRLHHMARREHGSTRARSALTRLVQADRRLLRLMFERLDHQFSGDNKYKADPDLFLELSDPELLTGTDAQGGSLIAEDVVRSQAAAGWGAVFRRHTENVWRLAVRRWLLVAGAAGSRHDALLDVLVAGGMSRTDVLSRLYVMAGELERSLPPCQERDRRLRDRVLQKIDIAQGNQGRVSRPL
jgi:hypothetical protein